MSGVNLSSMVSRKPKQPRGQRLFRCACLLLALLLAIFPAVFTAGLARANEADSPALRRWAIVASPAVWDSGLADLLTAELSQLPDVELVERERLDAILKEQELASLSGAKATGRRVKLGQLLGADALVLPSLVQQDKKTFLKLVISDCHIGARLHMDAFLVEEDRGEYLAKRCASAVNVTIERVGDGLKYVIGVTPFLSQDDAYDYAHLQSAYSQLLQQALTSVPQVAVLELEEARAIARELAIQEGELKARLVPLIINGEYRVERATDKDAPLVHLSLRVQEKNDAERKIEVAPTGLPEMAERLLVELPRKILRLADDQTGSSLTLEQQFAALAARANTFGQLGMWDLSVPLREAALLIDPNDGEQRLHLVEEALPRWVEPIGKRSRAFYVERERKRDLHQRNIYRHWRRQSEQLIRRRLVNVREAAYLVKKTMEAVPGQRYHRPAVSGSQESKDGGRTPADSMEFKYLDDLRDFFLAVEDIVPTLDPTVADGKNRANKYSVPMAADLQYGRWSYVAAKYILVGGMGAPHGTGYHQLVDTARLARIRKLFVDQLPRSMSATGETLALFVGSSAQCDGAGGSLDPKLLLAVANLTDESRKALDEFYDRLEATGSPANVFYARVGRLLLEEADPDITFDENTFARIDALVEMSQKVGEGEAEYAAAMRQKIGQSTHVVAREASQKRVGLVLSGVRRRLEHELKLKRGERQDWNYRNHGLLHPYYRKGVRRQAVTPRFEFKSISYPLSNKGHLKIRNFDDRFDLIANEKGIYLMLEKGKLTPITIPEAYVHDEGHYKRGLFHVSWDGEYLWIKLDSADESKRGALLVVSLDAKEQHVVSLAEGLPAVERVHALAPGRVMATGVHLPTAEEKAKDYRPRRWFAEIAKHLTDDGKVTWRVRQFHLAKKIVADATANGFDDIDLSFSHVRWIHDFPHPQDSQRKIVLMGRYDQKLSQQATLRPLAIDPATLKVSISPYAIPKTLEDCHPMKDGHFLLPIPKFYPWGIRRPGYYRYFPADPKPEEWFDRYKNRWTHNYGRRKWKYFQWTSPGAVHGGYLYPQGAGVYRVHRETAELDRLVDERRLSIQSAFRSNSVNSAFYGLIVWGPKRSVSQLIVRPAGESKPSKKGKADTDTVLRTSVRRFVPVDVRHRHLEVANELWQRDATSSCDASGTYVVLTRGWGGDWSQLIRLTDLWQLVALDARPAQISDGQLIWLSDFAHLQRLMVRGEFSKKGIASLSNLKNLMTLTLVLQGQMDDQDLAPLADLTSLEQLNIIVEVDADSTISDKAFAHVGKLENLKKLVILDGRDAQMALKDATLEHIRGLSNLQRLTVGSRGFADAALKPVADLENLRELKLFGYVFRDPCLLDVARSRSLTHLVLFDTSITSTAIARLFQKRPEIKFGQWREPATTTTSRRFSE